MAKITIRDLVLGSVSEGMTTDLGEGGCGVRVFELFPTGAKILLEITRNETSLVASATVAYSLPPTAMGLSFADMSARDKKILARWLDAAVPTVRRNYRP